MNLQNINSSVFLVFSARRWQPEHESHHFEHYKFEIKSITHIYTHIFLYRTHNFSMFIDEYIIFLPAVQRFICFFIFLYPLSLFHIHIFRFALQKKRQKLLHSHSNILMIVTIIIIHHRHIRLFLLHIYRLLLYISCFLFKIPYIRIHGTNVMRDACVQLFYILKQRMSTSEKKGEKMNA